jgi:hypothetical protein
VHSQAYGTPTAAASLITTEFCSFCPLVGAAVPKVILEVLPRNRALYPSHVYCAIA